VKALMKYKKLNSFMN